MSERALKMADRHSLPSRPTNLEQRLIGMVRDCPWLMAALSSVRALGLPSWCIGAGAVRNLVWNHLHGFANDELPADIDVVYFDPSSPSPDHDADIQSRLAAELPDLPWEVTNQAGVHLWLEDAFGHPVPPLESLTDAVGSWPEYATAVGVTLRDDDSIQVIAPHGLNDLFSLVVRHNPVRISEEGYRRRIVEKRYAERWPKVSVVPCVVPCV